MTQHSLTHTLKNILSYLALFLIAYTTINWWRQPEMPTQAQLQLQDIQGHTIDLAAMSQKEPVLIYFWGSWCGACHISSPIVNELAQQGYPIVTIATQSGNTNQLSHYMQQKQLHFTTINDPQGHIFHSWQGKVTPSFAILNNSKMTQGFAGIQPAWLLKLRLWSSKIK